MELIKNIKAKVTKKITIYNEPVAVGAVVEVDANTFRNLLKKGWLAPVEPEPVAAKGK